MYIWIKNGEELMLCIDKVPPGVIKEEKDLGIIVCQDLMVVK